MKVSIGKSNHFIYIIPTVYLMYNRGEFQSVCFAFMCFKVLLMAQKYWDSFTTTTATTGEEEDGGEHVN